MCLRLIGRSIRFQRSSESGNVFMAIFGAIALVGLLGASIMTFMKGPLSTSVKLTKMNTAENQMAIGAQVAVMATASQANNGDCETSPDGFVEPMEWRVATTEPHPVNGGLVPSTLGISKKDPWGTEYGYCVWNHGPQVSGAGCGSHMLIGENSKAYPVVAIISAGPDKNFTTTCRDFTVADVNGDHDLLDATDLPLVSKAAETDDDIITSFTYDEATGASGGLWSLKSGAPGTAVIGKNIETTGKASFGGGLLLPDKSFVTCDASTAGVMAKNGTTGIEICDGTRLWKSVAGGGVLAGNGLVISPVVSSGMNVTGGCGTSMCYSSNVTFVLQNNLTVASAVLVTSLSNTANFEFVSNNCNVSLAAGANCQMVVRAKASGNISYAGTLNVNGNNSPFATLDGVASSFAGCNAGGNAPGGYYVACGVSGSYNLITTPSGCTSGNTNPTCPGGADTLQLYNNDIGTTSAYMSYISGATAYTGQQNTANLMGYSGGAYSFPAASWCDGLVYAGYSDWFLPSLSELTYLYNARALVGAATGGYWTSTEHNFGYAEWKYINFTGGTVTYATGSQNLLVRCMRRDPVLAMGAMADTTPVTFAFSGSYGNPAETRTSTPVTIYGVSQPISISIGGGTAAKFSINGAAYTSTATTVTNGDTITLQATSPSLGQESVVTLTTGAIATNWTIRTPGNNMIRIFTTATAYNGNLGGLSGADTICTSAASGAGMTGNWTAVMASGNTSDRIDTRLPWNWKTLKNMNGATVATSNADFMDGSISAPMNITQTGAVAASSLIWTGTAGNGISPNCAYWSCGANQVSCGGWTSSSSSYNAMVGDSASTAGGAYFATGSVQGLCANTSYRLLCMESNSAGSDLDPANVTIPPQVTFTSGGLGTSNTITIQSVTDAIPISITPVAGGTANIIQNGVSLGATTTTAGLNETLTFTLTAPTTLGTKNTATISLGPDTYTWWVGYADTAKEAKVFITSTTYQTSNFGGLTGMDNICNNVATTSSYGLSASWKAMASDSTTNMMARIPWNWGVLKTVTGTTIANGYNDLIDGSILSPINVMETGVSNSSYGIATGSDAYGIKYSPYGTTAAQFANDWTDGGCGGTNVGYGNSASTTQWAYIGVYSGSCGGVVRLYCIEDVDNATVDTIPTNIAPSYPVQVATSSRQTSTAVTVSGMSSGATTTLSVTATGGTPTFTINGGSEVTSGSIKNGDSLVFLMNAPASGNANNRLTMTVGGSTVVGYWRVWTGDTTGTVIKRVFVGYNNTGTQGTGIGGYDSYCTSAAAAQSLGGTWKAIISGVQEQDYAVNRVGYNWTTLRRVDGTDVVMSGNLWSTATTPLLAAINKSEANANVSVSNVLTNTLPNGNAANTTGSATYGGSCNNWGTYSSGWTAIDGTSGTSSSSWIYDNSPDGNNCYTCCGGGQRIYCIEQ